MTTLSDCDDITPFDGNFLEIFEFMDINKLSLDQDSMNSDPRALFTIQAYSHMDVCLFYYKGSLGTVLAPAMVNFCGTVYIFTLCHQMSICKFEQQNELF